MFLFFFKQTLRVLGIIIILLLFIRGFVIEPGRVNGVSMEPTFIDTDWFIVNKFILLLRAPRRGDIVQAIDPISKRLIIKRVIGLPGEQLAIHDGSVYMRHSDGTQTRINETWLKNTQWTTSSDGTDAIYVIIKPHSYFLIGDNRDRSTDSRVFGSVHRSNIYGLVMKPPF